MRYNEMQMALEFFQYQVNKRWYHLYWVIMLVFSLAFAALYVMGEFMPSFASYKELFAITPTTAVLTGTTLVYLLGMFWFVARTSLPFATLIGAMLYIICLVNGLVNSPAEAGGWLYAIAWLPTIFMSGIYGLPLLSGSVFLTFLYAGFQSTFDVAQLTRPTMLLLASAVAFSVMSYYFWRTRFVSIEEQRVNQLSGMLRSNQQQSVILIQSISDGIIVTDPAGKISLMNPAAAKLTEWSVNEALGVDVQLVLKLSHEDGSEVIAEEDPFQQVATQKKPTNQVFQLTGREDKKKIVSLSLSPIIVGENSAPMGTAAVIRDISEERAAEKQRGEFISTASHEMRTPVAAIEGYLALALNEKVSTIDSRARSYLEKAHSSTQHLGKLFQDLLTSSKAEDGRLTNHPSVVEMGAFMQQLTDDLKFAAEKKGLLAEFVIGGADATIDATTKDASTQHLLKPLYYVHVDPDRMREVITNLFDNACKYTDSGKISIGLTGNSEVVQLYIRDTGAGIPPDDLPHLFQKFYRVDNSATRTIGGTGLGLFISRKIVELYHGRIWVESQVGKGSTFFINLPRLTTGRAAELQASEAAKVTSTPSTPGNT